MPRLHLFEFNDQRWLPDQIRDGMTGYLETVSRKFGAHKAMTPVVQEILTQSEATHIIDLCSGSTGPVLDIREELDTPVPVLLTDKFPNKEAFSKYLGNGEVRAKLEPVDAMDVPEEFGGMRTVFNALHHFKPDDAKAILKDAADKNTPIVVGELVGRTPLNILTSPLIILMTYFLMPFVRPFRIEFLFLTYMIPVLPWLIFFDGLVSHLRAYTVEELEAMTKELERPGYEWKVKLIEGEKGIKVTMLTGCPVPTDE